MSSSSGFGGDFADWLPEAPINEQQPNSLLLPEDPYVMLEALSNAAKDAKAAEKENQSGNNKQPDTRARKRPRDEDDILSTKPGDPNRRDLPVVVLKNGPLEEGLVCQPCQPGRIIQDVAMETGNPITVMANPESSKRPKKKMRNANNKKDVENGMKWRSRKGDLKCKLSENEDGTFAGHSYFVKQTKEWKSTYIDPSTGKMRSCSSFKVGCWVCLREHANQRSAGKLHEDKSVCFGQNLLKMVNKSLQLQEA